MPEVEPAMHLCGTEPQHHHGALTRGDYRAVQELRAPVFVPVQYVAGRVVGADRQDGPVDVVDVGQRDILHVHEVRQRGPFGTPPEGCTKPCPIARAMSAAHAAWRASLQAVSIADLVGSVEQDSGPEALPAIGTWLNAALGSDG